MKRKKRTFNIPRLGLVGKQRLREAEISDDMIALKDLLEGALRRLFTLEGDQDAWAFVQALFEDHVVVEREGKLLKYPYTVEGSDVTFGEPEEVFTTFESVDGGADDTPADNSNDGENTNSPTSDEATFTEAVKQGRGARAFDVCIIRAGLSLNDNYYPNAVLREGASKFEGARVFVKSDDDHLAGRGTDVRNLLGRMTNIFFKEGKGHDNGAIYGTFEIMEPEGEVAIKLREAWDNKMADLFGFSIDASGAAVSSKVGGRPVRRATTIAAVDSVDLIVRPGAGGGIINFKESENTTSEDDTVWRDKIIKAIMAVAPDLLEGVDVVNLTDEELEELYSKAFAEKAPSSDITDPDVMEEVFTEAEKRIGAKMYMREAIGRCSLPEPAKARLRESFGKKARYTEAEVDNAIRGEMSYLSSFGGGHVSGLGGVNITRSGGQGTAAMLDDFFKGKGRSFRECYIRMTGDERVTGRLSGTNRARYAEALDSQSWELVLGDAIHRQLLEQYKMQSQFDIWKYFAHITSLADFRNVHRTRFGGYGDLPVVAESADYKPLTSPGDEEAKYSPVKRGGTEKVTLEMIKNDDVGAIQQIPNKLNGAAKRTLGKFVLDFMLKNPVIYDQKNLFHVDHGNLGTAALSDESYAAARLAVIKQKEPGSNAQIGTPPRNLWVPADLEPVAFDMFRRDTNHDETFIQSQHPRVISVWYWEDPKDWILTTDLSDMPCFELGFLDGQEEPDLFVQDNPTVGSLFNNDTITYKIRHIYGGAITDYRGMYKAVVAGE